jgi:prepilin-type N-terminal cleavage/methylation domain-containing protein
MKKKFLHGFTLIELLVVITIIGILAGIAIPTIAAVIQAAKKTEAKVFMSSLATSVANYQTEYNTYPPFMSSIDPNNAILQTQAHWQQFYTVMVVPPSQTNSSLFTSNNARQIPFLTVQTKYLDNQTDPTTATYFKDPWDQLYKMWVDTDYNNVVTSVTDIQTGSGTKSMPGSVLVWSAASDEASTNASSIKKSIGTWK